MPGPATAAEVLDFWFGCDAGQAQVARRRWFQATAEDDAMIRERFAGSLDAAAAGDLATWADAPHSRLALIVLCDQFSRNIHRGTARAFALDALALRECLFALAAGETVRLDIDEQASALMPLEHAEDPQLQQRSVAEFERLAAAAPADAAERASACVRHAREHRDIIARFGRFPHRNAALGRADTAAERQWLAAGAPRYGQAS